MKSELESMKKELEQVNSSVKSKAEELKALEDRLESESAAKLAELKKKLNKNCCHQEAAVISNGRERTAV